MRIAAVVVTIAMALLSGPAAAQSVDAAFTAPRSPEEISSWLSGEFEYVLKMPDEPQTVTETLRARSGDCDDFAFLSKAALESLGIAAEVVMIRFRGLSIRHAICVWKTPEGTCDFFSSSKLHHTRQRSVPLLVEAYYPGWKEIAVINEEREPVRVIARRR